MPRSPTNYTLPPGSTPVVPDTVILSAIEQAFRQDVEQTFNTPQPIEYGGTNATTAAGARTNLGIVDASVQAFADCRLVLDGANLRLNRFSGRLLTIASTQQQIPAAGVALSVTGLSANTLYDIYAYMNGSTMTLEASTTGFMIDSTTGIAVKSGDPSRTYVGMARTVTGPAWADTASRRLVSSYYNRRTTRVEGAFTTTRTTSSTSFVELNSEIRFEFLSWGDNDISFGANGSCYTNPGGGSQFSRITLDGAVDWVAQQLQTTALDYTIPVTMTGSAGPSRGYHYATLSGRVSTGTGNWTGSTADSRTLIFATVQV